MHSRSHRSLLSLAALCTSAAAALVLAGACSAGGDAADAGGSGASSGASGQGGDFNVDGGTGTGGTFDGDPVTCAQAAENHTYVGCDFYPTVLPNYVGTHFDYAVVVANASDKAAQVTIERAGQPAAEGEVPPNGLRKFFLPWVESKHFMGKCDTDFSPPFDSSASHPGAAYHLSSSVPVTVYQFNPLEYQPAGGPPGKDWSACVSGCIFGCKSYTNDASLLLPSTAATGNYRVTGMSGIESSDGILFPSYFVVTGLSDGTIVTVQVGSKGSVLAGGPIPAAGPGEVFQFPVNRGDVVRVLGPASADLAGSLVQSSQPVQVMAGMPCTYLPADRQACDHIEESVFPAETLGKRYFVGEPTAPSGDTRGHVVRLFGNVDGTTLTFPSGAPSGAPSTIDAGDVVDLGIVEQSFEVVGNHEFAVSTFMLGSTIVDPDIFRGWGDPSQTNVASVEQYRKKYVFLAPDDYEVSFADIVMPDGAQVVVDGAPVAGATPIGSGYGIARVELSESTGGSHVLVSDQPVGLQVMGYGFATSYHYPGGLNLRGIAPPPAEIPVPK